jgi:acetamidase/formamidase
VTGPIEVKGAKAGDMLKVTIHKVAVEGIGTTALWPGVGIFPDWCRQKEFGIKNHNVLVKDGIVHWSDKVKLPVKPMIGCIATAPVNGGLMTVDCDKVGGNLDVQ